MVDERVLQEQYGTGFHDGYIHRKNVVDRLFTKADWRLWIAAAIGFILGVVML